MQSAHFGFVLEENSRREIRRWSRSHCFRKALFSKCSLSTIEIELEIKLKYSSSLKSVFEKLHFRDGLVWTIGLTVKIKLRFQISPVWRAFSWRISVDGRPNRKNKAAFSWRISVDGRPNRRNKATFSWRISVDGRPNRKNKAAFSNFSGLKSVFVTD